jgi:peptidoglycan/LPS O-acetylase OafA/YrhL
MTETAGVIPRQEKLQQRAVKAGIRASKRRHHVLSAEEVRGLKVQVMPVLPRALLAVAGVAMIVAAVNGLPPESNAGQGFLAIGGIFLTLFAMFGVRRTLSGILDNLSADAAGNFIGVVIESIGDAVDF